MGKHWNPPVPSTALRKINLRSRASYRGSVLDPTTNRELAFESKIERDLFVVLSIREDVASIDEQSPVVTYRDSEGNHTHTFDALVTMTDGRRIAVDVKPLARVASSGIEEIHRAIREQHGRLVADDFIIRTEAHVHPADVADAELILRARREPDPAADDLVIGLVAPTGGEYRVADLVTASGLGSAAFNAIARLVGSDVLSVVGDDRLSHASRVKRRSIGTEASR